MTSSILPKPNFVTFVMSSTLLFFISGLTLFLFLFSESLVAHLQSQIHHVIEIKKDIENIDSVIEILKSSDQVDTSTIVHMPPSIAIDFMRQETGMDFSLGSTNPFSQLITFNAQKRLDIGLHPLEKSLSELKTVNNLYFQHGYKEVLSTKISHWKKYLVIIGLIIGLFSFVLLSHLLRVILYNDRKKLKTMELVGATRQYILMPYLIRFTALCFASMIICLVIFWALGHYVGLFDTFGVSIFLNIKMMIFLATTWIILMVLTLALIAVKIQSHLIRPYEELI